MKTPTREKEESARRSTERERTKSEEELFMESERLARQLMEEESLRVMQRLQDALREPVDEDSIARMEEDDPDLAFAMRLQREEAMAEEEETMEFVEGDEEDEEMTYEEMLELGQRIGDVKEERWKLRAQKYIEAMPLIIFDAAKTSSTPRKCTMETCLVCQCAYEDGDTLKKLPCGHLYHVDCIDPWLGMKNTCPVCKKSVSTP